MTDIKLSNEPIKIEIDYLWDVLTTDVHGERLTLSGRANVVDGLLAISTSLDRIAEAIETHNTVQIDVQTMLKNRGFRID